MPFTSSFLTTDRIKRERNPRRELQNEEEKTCQCHETLTVSELPSNMTQAALAWQTRSNLHKLITMPPILCLLRGKEGGRWRWLWSWNKQKGRNKLVSTHLFAFFCERGLRSVWLCDQPSWETWYQAILLRNVAPGDSSPVSVLSLSFPRPGSLELLSFCGIQFLCPASTTAPHLLPSWTAYPHVLFLLLIQSQTYLWPTSVLADNAFLCSWNKPMYLEANFILWEFYNFLWPTPGSIPK